MCSITGASCSEFYHVRTFAVCDLVLIRYLVDKEPESLIQTFSFTHKSSSCSFLKERPIFLLVALHGATESRDGATIEPSGGEG